MQREVLSEPRLDVYQTVTTKIVAAIEAGAGEFVMPWHRNGPAIGRATNASTGARYRGVNVVALWAEASLAGYGSGHWASYLQWQHIGAQVRKGEHGSTIVFYRKLEPDESAAPSGEEEGAEAKRFVAKASRVFNAEQVEGWTAPGPSEVPAGADPIERVERFIHATEAHIRHGTYLACYRPGLDRIDVPSPSAFRGTPTSTPTESYYATVLHELVHWTGAEHRLNRVFGKRFGDNVYAAEELVAELGAAFLCADLRVSIEPRADHAAYLNSWLTIMRSDARAIFAAAKLATEASDFLFDLQPPGSYETP